MLVCGYFFFFNDTATTEIYTLSLHDALPILAFAGGPALAGALVGWTGGAPAFGVAAGDRKSTRLNSSHTVISYAVFCLKKKKKKHTKHGHNIKHAKDSTRTEQATTKHQSRVH